MNNLVENANRFMVEDFEGTGFRTEDEYWDAMRKKDAERPRESVMELFELNESLREGIDDAIDAIIIEGVDNHGMSRGEIISELTEWITTSFR